MEFGYFPIKGIGEPIRMLLVYLGLDWREFSYQSRDDFELARKGLEL